MMTILDHHLEELHGAAVSVLGSDELSPNPLRLNRNIEPRIDQASTNVEILAKMTIPLKKIFWYGQKSHGDWQPEE